MNLERTIKAAMNEETSEYEELITAAWHKYPKLRPKDIRAFLPSIAKLSKDAAYEKSRVACQEKG